MAFQDFVYLSRADFTVLRANGTAVVNGVELTYDPIHTQYYVYDNTEELIADMQAAIAVQSAKVDGFQTFIDNLTLEANYPVGSRYTQYPDEPTPAERFGGQWELDEDAMDKFLVGAGNLYALGATGGSANAVLVQHGDHLFTWDGEPTDGDGSGNTPRYLGIDVLYEIGTKGRGWNAWSGNEAYPAGKSLGEDGTNKNLPPYLAVNIWKRTA